MEVSSLTLFVEVMRRGSFSEVAKSRRVAPSSVSRAIAALESELGIRLFHRNTRKLEPTEAGLIYFKRIVPLMDEFEAARDMAADVSKEPKGWLRVTAPTVFGQKYLVPLLPTLQKKYPLLTIELLFNDAYVDLIGERIDVAIRLGSLQDSGYIAQRLRSMRFYICASPDYLERQGRPLVPGDIAQHECLLFPRSGYNLNWLFKHKTGHIEEVPIAGHCLVTNSEAIRQCALSGMGLALLPDWLVEADFELGTLAPLFEEFAVTATDYKGAVWIVRPSREYLPLKTRVFIDALTGSF